MGIRYLVTILFSTFLLYAPITYAGMSLSPYVKISSTKQIKPEADAKEKETLKQREEYGFNFSLSFWRLMSFTLGVGQNNLTTTEKVQDATDEFGEIDYQNDLNMSTDDPDKEVVLKETQNKGRVTLALDPGFWIFICKAKLGVTATQRIFEKEEEGEDPLTYTSPITYNPHAGLGFGVRLSRQIYWMAEYEAYFYKFPETEPFERAVSVSFGVSI